MRITGDGKKQFYGNGEHVDSDGDGLEIKVRHYDVTIFGRGRLNGITRLSHADFIALADEMGRLAAELKADMAELANEVG